MKRNLESRVEVVAPVESETLRKDLRNLLDVQLSDRRNAWEMQSDGTYVQRQPADPEEEKGCQERLIEFAQQRFKQAKRYQQGRTRRHIAGRNLR
jgi:polyphosphate kinase